MITLRSERTFGTVTAVTVYHVKADAVARLKNVVGDTGFVNVALRNAYVNRYRRRRRLGNRNVCRLVYA